MIIIVILKPDFVYDHKNKQYREFGFTQEKTVFTMPIIAILLAIIMTIIFRLLKSTDKKKKTKYKYIPIPISQLQQEYIQEESSE